MTTDDLPTGQPAATLRKLRGVSLILSMLLSAPVLAQEAPVAPAETVASPVIALEAVDSNTEAPAKAATPANSGIREKAAEAATATLAALLPRLAASDSLPLLDRSTMVAGDLSRLLSGYELNGGVVKDEGGKIQAVLKRAMALMGTPYRWGGTSPDSGFDCSGLVGYVFRSALGIDLPRVSRDIATQSNGQMIAKREDLKQGDLVFFGLKGRINHVGIYVGEGRFLHSPSTGKDVRVDSLLTGYWAPRFMQARRIEM